MKTSYLGLAIILALLNAIGPFAIDTYLPAFPAIERSLDTTPVAMQQSLTAYMLPFSFMMLWHGAISDALGRRRVILVGLVVFLLASLLCLVAPSIHMLWLGRVLQGLSAGVGVIVGRAIVRDVLSGAQAQRLMSHVAMVFSLAPALAPILGGLLADTLGWRSIFALLVILPAIQIFVVWRFLPETLPPEKRQSLHPAYLFKAYTGILSNKGFWAISLAMSFFFGAFFQYVMSAPAFLIGHLHLQPTEFGWLFIPVVCGMLCGSGLSSKLAGKVAPHRTVLLAFMVAGLACVWNLLANFLGADVIVTRIPQIALYTFAMNLAFPSLMLMALDMYPEQRGTAASCQGFIHTLIMAVGAGLIAPLLWHSTLAMAWGMAVMLALAGGLYYVHNRLHQQASVSV
ncbi:multidrug effflux MFS transporter [Uliginosibacterium gangwonense]|uniref:multidrug effflux MFS transporter n=1 Tax=Uliginosibacterium gangwonense TaxID=392736 RepID=UPI000362C936|nr:multidrug effflux MFS transporter [Uliginosibacterium gangwonense]